MTKRELIEALEALDCGDDTLVELLVLANSFSELEKVSYYKERDSVLLDDFG